MSNITELVAHAIKEDVVSFEKTLDAILEERIQEKFNALHEEVANEMLGEKKYTKEDDDDNYEEEDEDDMEDEDD